MDEKQISELLECSVCLERFDQSCKVLPCQHTFCRQCLDEIILTKHELRCPECRALVTVRVADLPTNILVVRILEGLKTKGHRSSGGSVKQQDHRGLSSSPSKGGGGSGQIPVHDSISGHGFRQGSQPCVKALYNYGSAEKEDLSFKKGDVILLKRKIDDNWFHGEIGGRSGFFPSNFVQVLVPLPQIPQCVSLYDFELKDEGEKDCLSFKKDEVLTVIRQVDENWLEGRKGDKIGIFPITFVKLNDSAKSLINTKSNLAIIPGSSSSCSNTPATITALSSVTTAAGTTVPPSYSKTDPSSSSSTAVVGSTATGSTGAVASSTISGSTNAAGCTSSSSSPPPPSSSLSVSTSNINDLITVLATGATISADPVVSSGVASTNNAHPDPSLVSTFLPQAPPETASEPEVLSQNKRHSFTSASLSSPMSMAPAGSTHAQQRHSAEVTVTAGGALSLVSSELVAASLSSSSLSSLPSAAASETQPAASSSPKNTSSLSPVHTEAATDIPASSSFSGGDAAQSGSLTTPLYSALYNYKPRKDDELELHKGDHYSVSEKCQDGWYKGMCIRSGMAGVFPGNYVQLIRHTSAFKPVSSNMVNVKSKASAVPHSSFAASHSVPVSDPRPVNQTSSETSLSQAPPLMPRVAKMNAAGQKSRSPSSQLAGTPLRSLSSPGTCSQSLSSSSSSPKHVFSSPLASSTQPPPSSHSGSSHMGLSRPLIPAPPPSTTSFPHRSLWVPPTLAALQTSMSASANITPPNVVAAQGLDPAAQTQALTVKDKRKKQDKEKKGLVKLLSGKSKKSKQAIPVESEPIQALAVVLGFDNGVHVRSGSYPVNGTTSSGLVGAGGDGSLICAHRKAASFDATTVPPVPAKPRPKLVVRERYCCIVPYPPQTEQELELELGDIIHVHRKREDGWYKGTQERTGKTGMFPASFVEKCD